MKLSAALAMPLALLLAACAFKDTADPISRKFTWYDYVGGGDIRRACAPGASDRYRFVYNAIYVEQVRTYDLQVNFGQPPARSLLTSRVIGKPNLSSFGVGQPDDVLGPWAGQVARTWLRDSDVGLLVASADETGLGGPAPNGLRLDSDGFWWTVAACRNGAFAFNAYQWPSDRFQKLQFPKLLFAWDQTGVAVNQPRKDTLENYGAANRQQEGRIVFQLEVGDDGLKGTRPLF